MVLLTELLPGSSSSSPTHDKNHIYDVFLSFRGADTRNRFTDHLYNALLDAGINMFLDDEEIETGEPLKTELESAVISSRSSIIVLSKNYASSTWCLDELVLILEQKRRCKQIVIPVFYDVEPTDVRKQQNSFGEAMAKHKQRMETETNAEKRSQLAQKMVLWKRALTEVANLKGRYAKDRKETVFIKELVTDIHRRLGVLLSNTLPRLVGMEYYIKLIGSWLTDGSCHTADILTLVGMGGIGKTSLARYVFGLHSSKFHKSSFIEGINTRCNQQYNGLLDLQKQLHGDISKKIELQVNDVIKYTSMIENALARERLFVVLDDIDTLNQLDALLGNKGLHPGSKVIITTKDASLTERYALFNSQVQPNHRKVSLYGLSESKSLELLCVHAFKCNSSVTEGYEDVSKELVKYCEGHPLALEVLGRYLHNQDVAYWENCIKVLKKESHSCINKALKMSYDSLAFKNDKDLFKHIACFFVGKDRDFTETILNACDLNTRSGIKNLTDRCLLSVTRNNKFMMHSLIQEMGRNLVREESPDKPWERSRLWCHEESFKVLEQKKGTENLLGLALDMRMLEKENSSGSLQLKTDALSKMVNLKLLQLNYVNINGSFKNISKELRWLCMHGFHFKSIPSELPMENLVALDMSHSNIESFDMSYSSSQGYISRLLGLIGSSSKDKRLLGSLKILDLSFCEQLHSVGGFLELPALERLIFRNCISLINVCESVGQCVELVHIDFSSCYNLKKIPISIGKLEKVKTLLLDGCNSLESQMETKLVDLKLIEFSIPRSLKILSLENNNLSNESFPSDLSGLSMLEELYLGNNPFVSVPGCVRSLASLQILGLHICHASKSLFEHPPHTLRELSVTSIGMDRTSLRKIKFDPLMSPLKIVEAWSVLSGSSLEIDGMVKVQVMADVDGKLLHSLSWTNIEFITERRLESYVSRESQKFQTQMYYEFGIFSTIYEGKEMPDWISCRSKGPSISFTIPSSPNKLRGLNFFCTMETCQYKDFWMPMIKVSNMTKNHIWIYKHYIQKVAFGGKCLSLLNHWMFGPNEMQGGDEITITVEQVRNVYRKEQFTMECGIGLVYDEDGKNEEEEEEDALGYYKSWNHIIGGDLSAFQLTTGEYILSFMNFMRCTNEPYAFDLPFIDGEDIKYEEKEVSFKAFSQKKYESLGEVYGTTSSRIYQVPLNNMFEYSTSLRSITQGKGKFTMEYKEHSPVSSDVQTQLINAHI